jgi:hypothetical protein
MALDGVYEIAPRLLLRCYPSDSLSTPQCFRKAFYPSSSAQRSANTRKGAPTKSRGEGEQRVTYIWLRLPQPRIDGRAGLRLFYGDKVKPNTRSTEARLLVRTTLSKLQLMNIVKKC